MIQMISLEKSGCIFSSENKEEKKDGLFNMVLLRATVK